MATVNGGKDIQTLDHSQIAAAHFKQPENILGKSQSEEMVKTDTVSKVFYKV